VAKRGNDENISAGEPPADRKLLHDRSFAALWMTKGGKEGHTEGF